MPRRTNPFQKLSTLIMATFYGPKYEVVESILLKNKKTGAVRELDIQITQLDNNQNKILVEEHPKIIAPVDEMAEQFRRSLPNQQSAADAKKQ